MAERKLWYQDFFGPRDQSEPLSKELTAGVTYNAMPRLAGLFQKDVPEPLISFRPASSTTIINHSNAYIVFGKDRPSGLTSGYGGRGALGCDTIDIVVGRMSASKKVNSRKKTTYVGNNFGADAARIYISQLTDIDKNFGIIDGTSGPHKGGSAIGIKADAVRIIGREGVKIVTGKAPFKGFGKNGETNSRGGKIIKPAPKIELIAGNSAEPQEFLSPFPFLKNETVNMLQPTVKGENLQEALLELYDMVDKLSGALLNLSLISTAFNSVVSVNPLPHYPGAGTAAVTQILNSVTSNIWQLRINSALWSLNYCTPFGYRYICSRNVSAT